MAPNYNHNPYGNYPFVSTEPAVDPDAVPAGTKKEIVAWVDGDPDRAAKAIEAEKARENPRPTVIDALKKV